MVSDVSAQKRFDMDVIIYKKQCDKLQHFLMKYFNLSHYIFARLYALVKETACSTGFFQLLLFTVFLIH